MNILITGIHGFVGSNLVHLLRKQHTIYGLDIVSPPKEGVFNTFVWKELDSIPPVDVVIHLAGKAHDTKKTTEEKEYFDINVGLTQKIFQHFLKSSATKFIFFSSVKAVADSVEGDHLTEEEIPNPQTPYGKSKLQAEKYILEEWATLRLRSVQAWRKDGERESRKRLRDLETGGLGDNTTAQRDEGTRDQVYIDKKVYILRPCMIHGPGNKGNLNLLYNLVRKGFPYPLGAFENKRSFTSIDNLSFVITQIIEKEIPGGIYNMADDESVSTNELIALIAQILEKPNRTWKWNKTVVRTCARLGTILHLGCVINKLFQFIC